jgi:4-oxalmesaconate hydratase
MAQDQGWAPPETLLRNVYFDTCIYHQAGIDLMVKVVPAENVLFGSETVGAVRGIDPLTGFHYDDTKRYIDAAELTVQERALVLEHNARRVYPRLDRVLSNPAGSSAGLQPLGYPVGHRSQG